MENVYLWLMGIFGGLYVLSLILGEFVHIFEGVDVGFHHVIDVFSGHPEITAPEHPDTADFQRSNPLSLRSLIAFLAFFGTIGYLSLTNGATVLLSLILSTLVGLTGAWVSWKLLVFLIRQSGSSAPSRDDYLARSAYVSTPIPHDGTGTVHLIVRGKLEVLPARTRNSKEIPRGTTVVVNEWEGGVLTVEPLD
ncbi:MAG: NfeD family protein [Patescibacteria group bacterium]|nr:NfeD family protein [Patescibacteria group bacterium]